MRTVARLAACVFAVSALALVSTSKDASGNGRFPSAQYVVAGPGKGSKLLALRTTFGVLLSEDSGKTFRYICEEALDYGGAAFDPSVAIDSTGRVLCGLYNGLVTVETDRCSFLRVPSLEGEWVIDLDQNATGEVIVGATATGWVERKNGVWRSTDSAKTFKATGAGLLGVQLSTLEMARTDPSRVYAAGLQIDPRKVVVYRSDDGGGTLIPLVLPDLNPIEAYVTGVDPTKADTFYVRVLIDTLGADAATKRATVLLRSDDKGATFKEAARTAGQMLGFALSDDGKTVWYGGPIPTMGCSD